MSKHSLSLPLSIYPLTLYTCVSKYLSPIINFLPTHLIVHHPSHLDFYQSIYPYAQTSIFPDKHFSITELTEKCVLQERLEEAPLSASEGAGRRALAGGDPGGGRGGRDTGVWQERTLSHTRSSIPKPQPAVRRSPAQAVQGPYESSAGGVLLQRRARLSGRHHGAQIAG